MCNDFKTVDMFKLKSMEVGHKMQISSEISENVIFQKTKFQDKQRVTNKIKFQQKMLSQEAVYEVGAFDMTEINDFHIIFHLESSCISPQIIQLSIDCRKLLIIYCLLLLIESV